MSYQKCPICNGTGEIENPPNCTATHSQCPTCKGGRIISEITGLPPQYVLESTKDDVLWNTSTEVKSYTYNEPNY